MARDHKTVDSFSTASRQHGLSLLNASGFAFQLAVEEVVRTTASRAGWTIAAREHPCRTATGEAYIDLVLKKEDTFLLVECKRTQDATWLFLMHDDEQLDRSHARIRWTNTAPQRDGLSDWGDIQIYPSSPESEFCVVRGQGEGHAPLLERLASAVTASVEGLADQVLELTEHTETTHLIVPVLVTNASLVLGRFSPSKVDLSSGQLDEADFSSISHIRFRKSLASASTPDDYEPEELRDLSASSERTVFVVRSDYLATWLSGFGVDVSSAPWSASIARLGHA